MAQKRMFDRAIIDTDKFMDLPMSAKAVYFLLGMEADDEGFVSYKKVLRIHGGNEDDVKVLVAKSFLISFPTGVVVITDWQKNNWLDVRRLRPTEYQTERKLLSLTGTKEYVLSTGLASIEERSTEQNRAIGVVITTRIEDDEEKPKKEKKDTTYLQVFALWGKYPINWRQNTTEIQAAKNLLEEHGLEDCKDALKFYGKHKHEEKCPQILKPSDLDRKWVNLEAHADRV